MLAFATLLLAALLASTAVAVSQWIGGDVVEPPVTRQEYLDAQKQLTLPPGVEWPDPAEIGLAPEPPYDSVTSRGAGGGMAVLNAMNAWECYWVRAIRRDDEAAGRRAHDELSALLAHNVLEAPAGAHEGWTPTPLPTVPFVVFAHDGGLEWVRGSYEQAAAGDPRNLIRAAGRTRRASYERAVTSEGPTRTGPSHSRAWTGAAQLFAGLRGRPACTEAGSPSPPARAPSRPRP